MSFVDTKGILHYIPVLVMILGDSRIKYVESTTHCDFRSMIRRMVNASEYFEGVSEIVLTDNMKMVVDHREAGNIMWNPQFADFAAQMDFVPKVCKVRCLETKEKVEWLVRYVKDNFFPRREFENLEDLNLQALQWCAKVDSKVHSTTGKILLQELVNESLRPFRNKLSWTGIGGRTVKLL